MTVFSVAKQVDPHSGLIRRHTESHRIDSFHFLNRDEAKHLPLLYNHAEPSEVVVVDENDGSLWLVEYREAASRGQIPPA